MLYGSRNNIWEILYLNSVNLWLVESSLSVECKISHGECLKKKYAYIKGKLIFNKNTNVEKYIIQYKITKWNLVKISALNISLGVTFKSYNIPAPVNVFLAFTLICIQFSSHIPLFYYFLIVNTVYVSFVYLNKVLHNFTV